MIKPSVVASLFQLLFILGLGKWWGRMRHKRWVTIGAATAAVAGAVGTGVYVGGGGSSNLHIGQVPTPTLGVTRVELVASRDMGALPARDSWCSGADHCWTFQQSSGTVTDQGDVGGWDLTPTSSPRAGVVSSLPLQAETIDYTSELASWPDGSAYFVTGSVEQPSTNSMSVTIVMYMPSHGAPLQTIFDLGYGSGQGLMVWRPNDTVMYVQAKGATTFKYSNVQGWSYDNSWHCITIVYDEADSKFWADGREYNLPIPLSGTGSIYDSSIYAAFGARGDGVYPSSIGIARAKIKHNTVWTLSDHQAHCGNLWQAPAGGIDNDKPSTSNDEWTQSGNSRCFPTSSTTAICVPGGLIPYSVDDTGIHWPPEQSQTNRILYSSAVDCTNWTCATATIAAAVAPDGSKTAAEITMGGGTVDSPAASGYTANATVYPRVWTKCSSGALTIAHQGGTGSWTVDCTHAALSGNWALINAAHAAVSVGAGWQATAGGALTMRFSGTDASIWMPTVTEIAGSQRMVIPTMAAAASTGNIAWVIDNSSGNYYQSGDTVTQSLTQYSGTCWYIDGTDLRLSGAAGSPCSGAWYGLEIGR